MKIIADQKIPHLETTFGIKNDLICLPAHQISQKTIKNADALILRSVTEADATLLENTNIQFVGSATAGVDHLDIDYLNKSSIAFAHSPGANAKAVSNYVLLSIASGRQQGLLKKNHLRAGVIGIGHVGQRVVNLLEKLGFEVLQNDPPRAKKESDFHSTSLDAFVDLDLICVHTALTFDGEFPSYHLIDQAFLSRQKAGCIFLNAARGAVVNSEALKTASQLMTILDVWENEPNIDLSLLEIANIATPHIAGYSKAAKYRATQMLYDAFCQHFNEPLQKSHDLSEKTVTIDLSKKHWENDVLASETLIPTSLDFKKTKQFKRCRSHYLLRDEFSVQYVTCSASIASGIRDYTKVRPV